MATEAEMPRDSTRTVDAGNPWLGLASFTEETREFFYGRDEEVAELARRHPGAQHVLDPALVVLAPLAELFRPVAGEGGKLVQEHPDVVGITMDDVDQLVTEHGQLLRRRPSGLGHPVRSELHLVHDAVVDGRQQLLLGADVVVQGSLAEIIGRTQLHDPGGVVTLSGEDLRGGVDDGLAPVLPLRAASGVPARLHAHECDASGNEAKAEEHRPAAV